MSMRCLMLLAGEETGPSLYALVSCDLSFRLSADARVCAPTHCPDGKVRPSVGEYAGPCAWSESPTDDEHSRGRQCLVRVAGGTAAGRHHLNERLLSLNHRSWSRLTKKFSPGTHTRQASVLRFLSSVTIAPAAW